MKEKHINDSHFLAWMTLVLIVVSLWIFKSYLHYLLVAAVLALSTSHIYMALVSRFEKKSKKGFIFKNREIIVSFILTSLFLLLLFGPLLYFVSMTYEQASNLDLDQIRQTLTEMADKTIAYLDKIPFMQEPLAGSTGKGCHLSEDRQLKCR